MLVCNLRLTYERKTITKRKISMDTIFKLIAVFFLSPKPILMVAAIVLFAIISVKRYRDLYFAAGDLIQNTTLYVCLIYMAYCLINISRPETIGTSIAFIIVSVFWSTIVKIVFNFLNIRHIKRTI